MAAKSEREPGVIDMEGGLLDPMAQDEEVEQEMVVVEEEQSFAPQMYPEPEMGAAAAEAAVYDTSPPLPHQNPSPIPAESAQPVMVDMAQLVAILAGMEANLKANTNGMKEINEKANETREEIKNNTNKMEANTKGMREEMKETRDEMRRVGQCLQAGKMATPRAATNELKGSAQAGEDRVSRETCRVTETVTETLNGVTETCTRETRRQLTETREITREVVERLHGVKEEEYAHTHTHT